MVDLWRPVLEDKIGARLDRLDRLAEDQAKFGDAVHDLLSALPLIVSKAGGELAAVSRFADWSRYWWVDTSVD